MSEIKNATITHTSLGRESHNIFTCSITLDYGGSGQGFGGYAFDTYDTTLEKRVGSAYGMIFIMTLLETLELNSWEDLKGSHVRADASMNKVLRIGHFLKDKWFDPEQVIDIRSVDENVSKVSD